MLLKKTVLVRIDFCIQETKTGIYYGWANHYEHRIADVGTYFNFTNPEQVVAELEKQLRNI